jgi:hypothetical protein
MLKRVGEVFEATFVTRPASFMRIQVKAAQRRNYRSYVVNSHHSERRHSKPYTKKDIDCFVAYAAPLQRWYVVSVEALKGYHSFRIFPKESRYARFEQYRAV